MSKRSCHRLRRRNKSHWHRRKIASRSVQKKIAYFSGKLTFSVGACSYHLVWHAGQHFTSGWVTRVRRGRHWVRRRAQCIGDVAQCTTLWGPRSMLIYLGNVMSGVTFLMVVNGCRLLGNPPLASPAPTVLWELVLLMWLNVVSSYMS
jgi:hypothetical protein